MKFKELTDLGLIAGLLAKGYSPHERRRDGKRVVFIFETDAMFEQLIEDYFNNRMTVDANKYYTSLKQAKTSIWQLLNDVCE